MKAVLDNPRHELYAQELAKGASQTEGYVTAGYKPDAAAACRLSRKVKSCVAEILGRAAERTVATIHDIAAQLDVDRKFARAVGGSRPNVADVMILGPAPAPMALPRGRHRYRLLIVARCSVELQAIIREWQRALRFPPGVRVGIDIDPFSFV